MKTPIENIDLRAPVPEEMEADEILMERIQDLEKHVACLDHNANLALDRIARLGIEIDVALDTVDQLGFITDRLDLLAVLFAGDPPVIPSNESISATLTSLSSDLKRVLLRLDAARKEARS